jgi:hypothetical protein
LQLSLTAFPKFDFTVVPSHTFPTPHAHHRCWHHHFVISTVVAVDSCGRDVFAVITVVCIVIIIVIVIAQLIVTLAEAVISRQRYCSVFAAAIAIDVSPLFSPQLLP